MNEFQSSMNRIIIALLLVIVALFVFGCKDKQTTNKLRFQKETEKVASDVQQNNTDKFNATIVTSLKNTTIKRIEKLVFSKNRLDQKDPYILLMTPTGKVAGSYRVNGYVIYHGTEAPAQNFEMQCIDKRIPCMKFKVTKIDKDSEILKPLFISFVVGYKVQRTIHWRGDFILTDFQIELKEVPLFGVQNIE